MGLKATIIHDKMMAMKMRDTQLSTILGTFIGELDRLTDDKGFPIKDPDDVTIIKMIKKTVEANTEYNMNPFETQVLSQYLPKTLSELELTTIIHTQITHNNYTIKDMGKIMQFLKENYPSQYDGKLASTLVKTALT